MTAPYPTQRRQQAVVRLTRALQECADAGLYVGVATLYLVPVAPNADRHCASVKVLHGQRWLPTTPRSPTKVP